ncbi:hypothetical protein [Xanthomarina spongicola]|uniref:Uncharacterized protein n=1 Tax=Xanthomarina spongicola TaxID=570520 RepID=A0A316DMI1_9FLAO|nr:hypothetical protein [Xanthomarina spongicola]PWK19095.1 hypothetical protein LX78_01573 [Xanthomarina spongicola]
MKTKEGIPINMEETKMYIHYSDKEILNVEFSYLIFNVDSINKKFGDLADFVAKYNLWGKTNGKLYILNEMVQPHDRLHHLIYTTLKPLGFKQYDDFVLGYEQLIKGANGYVSPLLDKDIPGMEDVEWLGSIITREGNFVWYREIEDWETYLEWRLENQPQFSIGYYQMLLIKYFEKHEPHKLKFEPKIIEHRGDKVIFGMKKHKGYLATKIDALLE